MMKDKLYRLENARLGLLNAEQMYSSTNDDRWLEEMNYWVDEIFYLEQMLNLS